MRVMIASDGPHAHYHIRMAWAKVFSAMGDEVILWDIFKKPAFDAFDELSLIFLLGRHTTWIGRSLNVSSTGHT